MLRLEFCLTLGHCFIPDLDVRGVCSRWRGLDKENVQGVEGLTRTMFNVEKFGGEQCSTKRMLEVEKAPTSHSGKILLVTM